MLRLYTPRRGLVACVAHRPGAQLRRCTARSGAAADVAGRQAPGAGRARLGVDTRPPLRRRATAAAGAVDEAHAAGLAAQDAEFQELRGKCGAQAGDVVLSEGLFGRGLFLPAGAACAQVVLSVPLHWALVVRGDLDDVDPDTIMNSRVYQHHRAWERANGVTLPDELLLLLDSNFPAEQRLAFFLLFAVRHGGDVWRELGLLLPDEDACPSPLLWRDADLRELQDTALAMQCSMARQTAARGYEGFLEQWPLGAQLHAALGRPSTADFVWALALVQSRGMADELPVPGARGERVAMIVPFADMANHYAGDPGFSGAVDDAGNAFTLTCCRVAGVPRGAELTVSYRDSASNLETMKKCVRCAVACTVRACTDAARCAASQVRLCDAAKPARLVFPEQAEPAASA